MHLTDIAHLFEPTEDAEQWLREVATVCLSSLSHINSLDENDKSDDDRGLLVISNAFINLYSTLVYDEIIDCHDLTFRLDLIGNFKPVLNTDIETAQRLCQIVAASIKTIQNGYKVHRDERTPEDDVAEDLSSAIIYTYSLCLKHNLIAAVHPKTLQTITRH